MSPGGRRPKRRPTYDDRILIRALLIGLPALLAALILLWTRDFIPELRWILTFLLVAFWWAMARALHRRIVHLLHTLSNMLAAIREGDFSIRARGARRGDPHGDVMWEINALTQMHREQRLDELETIALLRKIMEEIDVAIFAFDARHKLRMVNRAAERSGTAIRPVIGRSGRRRIVTEGRHRASGATQRL